jgi:hypothetical protein
MSSPKAVTSFPLSPKHCLHIEQGPPRSGSAVVDSRTVRQVNLRTYGWADRFIFGRGQHIVTRVRAEARKQPGLVVRPRQMKQVMLFEADPDDPSVGLEHVKRGWPRGLWHKDETGKPQFVGYEVLDPKDRRFSAGAAGATVGRRVIDRAIDLGQAPSQHRRP